MIWYLLLIGYSTIAEVVACLGAFGIAVGNPDRWARAKARKAEQSYQYEAMERGFYQGERWPLIWITVGVALLWPIGVPIYLAVAKGHMVAAALKAWEQ